MAHFDSCQCKYTKEGTDSGFCTHTSTTNIHSNVNIYDCQKGSELGSMAPLPSYLHQNDSSISATNHINFF